jgi:hypothetical protein
VPQTSILGGEQEEDEEDEEEDSIIMKSSEGGSITEKAVDAERDRATPRE